MTDVRIVLLHCCCAPCSSAIIEWMLINGIRPVLYYCNPNIFPSQEYNIRKDECTRYAHSLGLTIIDEDYNHQEWLDDVKGLEDEPERGSRCLVCFKHRLLKTAHKAVELGISVFTTTLASSRWKSLDQINEAGHWAASSISSSTGVAVHFDDRNWRKGGLQQRRNELLKINGFYNQLYCGCEFSLEAMRRRYLPEVKSTNSYVNDMLARGVEMVDETVVYTMRQSAGRGQMGNVWESEPDKNIAFSMLLSPSFLPIRQQFIISEICSLGVLEGLRSLCLSKNAAFAADQLCIKWPNDIYAGDLKLGGILIENRLVGSDYTNAVLGVGINVNQVEWLGDAPNPVSLLQLGVETTPREVLEYVVSGISRHYHLLKDDVEDVAVTIHDSFKQHLYRRDGYFAYLDPETNERFDARIVDVDPLGPLMLQTQDGDIRRYWFKEVRFVLPCGVTKE